MASAINLTALSTYVDERTDSLLTKAVLGAKTLDVIDVMLDVKYKAPLNYLDSTVVFADASTCGWDASGADVFTQRMIEVSPVKVNKEWCARDMRKYWMNWQLLIDANRETLPFEEKIVDENLNAINKKLETAIWQETSLFTGLLGHIAADASDGIKTYDASAGVDYSEVIDKAYGEITDDMFARGEVTMFVSPTVYRGYISELNAVCCANREAVDAASDFITYPGDSRVTIRPTFGLAGAKISSKDVYVVCTWAKNLVFGTDVENSENDFKVWYDDKDEMTRFKVLFNAGTQIKFPSEVITIRKA
jgi:hypothetical protein